MLDLDRFKTVNDTYGHEYGNDLLTQVGHRLAILTLPVVSAARLSDDEFALVIAGERAQTAAVADAALQFITGRPVRVGSDEVAVSASVGYATAALGVTSRELLHAADLAMYRAKCHGRATVYGLPASTGQAGIGRASRHRDLTRADDPDASTHDDALPGPSPSPALTGTRSAAVLDDRSPPSGSYRVAARIRPTARHAAAHPQAQTGTAIRWFVLVAHRPFG